MMGPIVERSKNLSMDLRGACIVYSLVPYLGIAFVPFGFVFGIYACLRSSNRQKFHVVLVAAILGVQGVLWALLYYAPILATVR
jgi:hypothetical protein